MPSHSIWVSQRYLLLLVYLSICLLLLQDVPPTATMRLWTMPCVLFLPSLSVTLSVNAHRPQCCPCSTRPSSTLVHRRHPNLPSHLPILRQFHQHQNCIALLPTLVPQVPHPSAATLRAHHIILGPMLSGQRSAESPVSPLLPVQDRTRPSSPRSGTETLPCFTLHLFRRPNRQEELLEGKQEGHRDEHAACEKLNPILPMTNTTTLRIVRLAPHLVLHSSAMRS